MVKASYSALTEGEVYVPGLASEYVAQKYGIPPDQIAKLGSAENPHGPSPKALAAVTEAASRIDLYPDWTAKRLRVAIGQKYGFDPDNVVCGSGETEVIVSRSIASIPIAKDAVRCFRLWARISIR